MSIHAILFALALSLVGTIQQDAVPQTAASGLAATGTLRAAFLATNPVQGRIDPRTGVVTGPVADLAGELARRLGAAVALLPEPNPAAVIERVKNRQADIGFRMITGGCFLRHDAIRYFDYDTVGDIVNANIAHDRGFFVGNHPRDLTVELHRLREVLDIAARV